jgi:hypothetical protein
MAMSSIAMQRRSRRRRQVAIFLTLGVIITVIALAVRYRTEERETADYLALVGEIAGDELTVSQGLRELLNGVGSLARPDIIDRLVVLGSRAEDLEQRLGDAVVTRPVAEMHGFMSVAAAAWTDGLAALGEGVVAVMDQPDDDIAAPGAFTSALDMLRIGDFAYERFLDAGGGLGPDIVVPQFPAIAYVGGEEPLDIPTLASRLRLRLSLAERRDVEITANMVPEPTGARNGVAVAPFTSTFDVTAIVTNSGNVLQEEIVVTLRLTRDGTGDEPFEERRIIPALDPATSISVEFLSLEVAPAALYTLDVSASIPQDADIGNNVWQLVFATNSE